MNNKLVDVQKKLLPDLLEVMQQRYQVLQYIRILQPIGRRGLAAQLNISERILRGEVMFLKDQGLVDIMASGMSITAAGLQLLTDLEDVMKDVFGLRELEDKVKAAFKLENVIIVPGNSDENDVVKKELGRACVGYLKTCLKGNNTVAVTGGTTLAAAAEMMTPIKEKKVLFVPARGGLGENVTYQANSICAKMAEQAQGDYRLLHVPDQVSEEAYKSIVEEPSVKEVLRLIKEPSIIVHGIGDALTMAKRRKTSEENVEKIREGHALGEAFGYYFNAEGKIVFTVNTVGLQLDDVKRSPCVIAVAGGESKAQAIAAYMKHMKNMVLITDEGAAKALLTDM
jgi:central glycolytic genes regulator